MALLCSGLATWFCKKIKVKLELSHSSFSETERQLPHDACAGLFALLKLALSTMRRSVAMEMKYQPVDLHPTCLQRKARQKEWKSKRPDFEAVFGQLWRWRRLLETNSGHMHTPIYTKNLGPLKENKSIFWTHIQIWPMDYVGNGLNSNKRVILLHIERLILTGLTSKWTLP